MEAYQNGCISRGMKVVVTIKPRYCDFPDHDKTHPINVVSKEYVQYIPSEFNVCFSDWYYYYLFVKGKVDFFLVEPF